MKRLFIFSLIIQLALCGSAQVTMQSKDDGILITESGKKVLFYQIKPKSKNGEYERSNYIHPLWAPDGEVLTEDFPADHLHHRGIFWAWHQIWIDGQRIGDPWAIKDFEQDVVDVEFIRDKSGAGVLKTEVLWKSDKWKKEGEKIPYIQEKTVITVHPENGNYRIIDFKIGLLALEENLKIGGSEDEKGYSGFSVRMKLPDDVKFTGPDGEISPKVTAVKSEAYVNVSGSVGENEKAGGIVIVDHPDNPGYPQPWILRAKNSMQNPAWPGSEAILLSTKKPVVLNYSLIVYSGEINNRKIERIIKN